MKSIATALRQPSSSAFWWDGNQWSTCRAKLFARTEMTGVPEFVQVEDGWVKGIFVEQALLPSHIERLQGPAAAPAASPNPSAGRPAPAAGAALPGVWPVAKPAPLFLAMRPGSLEALGFGNSVETARADAVQAALEACPRDRRRNEAEAAARMAADLLVFQLVDGRL